LSTKYYHKTHIILLLLELFYNDNEILSAYTNVVLILIDVHPSWSQLTYYRLCLIELLFFLTFTIARYLSLVL